MSEQNQVNLEQLKLTHGQLAFIHQVLTRNQFFVDEFEVAKDALRTITEMCNKIADQIMASEAASAATNASDAAVVETATEPNV